MRNSAAEGHRIEQAARSAVAKESVRPHRGCALRLRHHHAYENSGGPIAVIFERAVCDPAAGDARPNISAAPTPEAISADLRCRKTRDLSGRPSVTMIGVRAAHSPHPIRHPGGPDIIAALLYQQQGRSLGGLVRCVPTIDDNARTTPHREITPHPIYRDDEPAAEINQKQDMDETPSQPAEQSTQLQSA